MIPSEPGEGEGETETEPETEPETAGDGGSTPFIEDPGAPVSTGEPETEAGVDDKPAPQPCLKIAAPKPCLKKRPAPRVCLLMVD